MHFTEENINAAITAGNVTEAQLHQSCIRIMSGWYNLPVEKRYPCDGTLPGLHTSSCKTPTAVSRPCPPPPAAPMAAPPLIPPHLVLRPSLFRAPLLLLHVLPCRCLRSFAIISTISLVPPGTVLLPNPCLSAHVLLATKSWPLSKRQRQPAMPLGEPGSICAPWLGRSSDAQAQPCLTRSAQLFE